MPYPRIERMLNNGLPWRAMLGLLLVSIAWLSMYAEAQAQAEKQGAALRSWKSKDGKFSTQGTMVEMVEEKVRLRKPDGKTADVAIDRLSAADQDFVKSALRVERTSNVSLGKVTKVLENHTIEFTDIDGAAISVKLDGVDLSETSPSVTQYLRSTLLGHFCWIESKTSKGEGLSGNVYVQGESINLELIAKGYAKCDPLTKLDPRFARAEKYASAKRLGVWGK